MGERIVDFEVGRLRPWRESDAESLVRHANDRRIWRNMRDLFPHPYTDDSARRFLSMAIADHADSFLAIEVDGQAVGGIGYTLHTDIERISSEIGYWLSPVYWGRGIMSAAVRAFTRAVFKWRPELERIYALPIAWNPASARVLERAGFKLEGTMRRAVLKDGEVMDQWLYGLVRSDLEHVTANVGR